MTRTPASLATCLVLTVATLLLSTCKASSAPPTVQIQDSAANHCHRSGEAFKVEVQVDQAGVAWRWVDVQGESLTDWTQLPAGEKREIRAPSGEDGFYDLQIRSRRDSPSRETRLDDTRSFGFLVTQDARKGDLDPTSHIGLCKPRMNGQYPGNAEIDPIVTGWIKSLNWVSTGPQFWKGEMDRRRKVGLEELPLVEGAEWETDDTKAISAEQLEALERRFRDLIAADPSVTTWEFGREENLSQRFSQPYYFENLVKKVHACEQIAREAGVKDFQAIYDIADASSTDALERFLSSPAAAEFQILSLHPYPWNNFPVRDYPSPEAWLPRFIDEVRHRMDVHHRNLPIWFTEAGAPVQETAANVPFGYPPFTTNDNGVSRKECGAYLTKFFSIAIAKGIGKIFWYEYADSGENVQLAEDVFGLVDSMGFPRPSYAAYATVAERLGKAVPYGDHPFRELPNGIFICEFRDPTTSPPRRIFVVWSRNPVAVPTETIIGRSKTGAVLIEAEDGKLLQAEPSLKLDGHPLFVLMSDIH